MKARGRAACIENRSPCAVCSQCVGLPAGAGEELAVHGERGKLLLEPDPQVLLGGESTLDPLPQDVVIIGAFKPVGFTGGGIHDEVEDKKTPANLGRQLPWQAACLSLRPGKIAKRGND
jgi:hypothetical protein